VSIGFRQQRDVPQGSQVRAGMASWEPPEHASFREPVRTLDRQSKLKSEVENLRWMWRLAQGFGIPWRCGCCASPMGK
jgi:hypothetical protein